MMPTLRGIWREAAIWYFEWALREIHPAHNDVPLIVLRLSSLKDERMESLSR